MYLTYDLYFDVLYSGRSSILSLSFSVLIVHFAFPHYKLIGFFLNTIGICCIKKLVTKQKLKRSEIDCIVLTNIYRTAGLHKQLFSPLYTIISCILLIINLSCARLYISSSYRARVLFLKILFPHHGKILYN